MFILITLLSLIIKNIQQQFLNPKIPTINIGDTIKLGLIIKEGDKQRTQYYEGVTISKKNTGLNKTITVRKIMQGIGIERVFLLHSPSIVSLEVKKSAKIRRAKLYYLRKLQGKATRLKQKY